MKKGKLRNKEFKKGLVSYGFGMERWIKMNWGGEENMKIDKKNPGKELFSYGFAMEGWIKRNWGGEENMKIEK